MTTHAPAHQPLRLSRARKTEVRTQFAVVAYRIEEGKKGPKARVCLVTSRGTKRWIVPKGWPMAGLSPAEAVQREAFEEAGVEGIVHPETLGLFSYDKRMPNASLPVIAVVYAMEVTRVHQAWPEMRERKRRWMSPKKAARRLADPELRRVLSEFDPLRRQG